MKKGGGRAKGHAYERQIAIAFRHLFPKALRQLEYQEGLGVDLQGTGNLRIQCKRGRQYAPLNRIEEIPEEPGTIPLLVTQGDRKETLVALRLSDFLELLKNPSHVKGIEHGRDESGEDAGSPEGREAN
jgi:hypothetical protein